MVSEASMRSSLAVIHASMSVVPPLSVFSSVPGGIWASVGDVLRMVAGESGEQSDLIDDVLLVLLMTASRIYSVMSVSFF